MDIEKIEKFYKTRAEYFKKKNEIARAMIELDMLLHVANADLKETVDNGLDDNYLIKVAKAYREHKFNSSVVCEFIEKIDNMFFKDLDPSLKNGLEVVSIKLDLGYSSRWSEPETSIDGPMSIDFHEIASDRAFRLYVPLKSSISADMVHWADNGDGMYIVRAEAPNANKSKEICKVFDQSKVAEAVEKYLKGEFDDELICETFVLKDKNMTFNVYYRNESYWKGFSNWQDDEDAKFVEVHDLFGSSSCAERLSDTVSNCICDIKDYAPRGVDS